MAECSARSRFAVRLWLAAALLLLSLGSAAPAGAASYTVTDVSNGVDPTTIHLSQSGMVLSAQGLWHNGMLTPEPNVQAPSPIGLLDDGSALWAYYNGSGTSYEWTQLDGSVTQDSFAPIGYPSVPTAVAGANFATGWVAGNYNSVGGVCFNGDTTSCRTWNRPAAPGSAITTDYLANCTGSVYCNAHAMGVNAAGHVVGTSIVQVTNQVQSSLFDATAGPCCANIAISPNGTYLLQDASGRFLINGTTNLGNANQWQDVNSSGVAVGYQGSQSNTPPSNGGLVWYAGAGAPQNLTGLLVPGSGWTIDEAVAINDNGQIAAIGHNATDTKVLLLSPQQLSVADVHVNEPASGQTAKATFTVTLSSPASNAVTVHYSTVDGSATGSMTAGQGDYTSVPDSVLTFNPGDTSKTVDVTVNGSDFVGNRTFTFNLSNATNASILRGTATGTIVGPNPLTVTITPTPNTVDIQQTPDGPTPQSVQVAVKVTDNAAQPVTDVTLPATLSTNWHPPFAEASIPLKQTAAPAPLDIGTVGPHATITGTYTLQVTGDGDFDLGATVNGTLQGNPVSALGSSEFTPTSQLLYFKATQGAEVHSQTNPGLIQAGTAFLINLHFENRSYYKTLAVSPIYPNISGNAQGAVVLPADTPIGAFGQPSDNLSQVFASPIIKLAPRQSRDFYVYVRTAASDQFADASISKGGTRASVKFDVPAAGTLSADGTTSTAIAASRILVADKSQDFEVGVDDGTPPPPPFTFENVTWSVGAGLLWGLYDNTIGAVRGLFGLVTGAIKGVYNISSATLYEIQHLVDLWIATQDDPVARAQLINAIEGKVVQAYDETPGLLKTKGIELYKAIDQSVSAYFSKLVYDWNAGDWRNSVEDLTRATTNVALIVAPGVLSRVPAAAAKWNALKTATFTQIGDTLAATVRVVEPAKAAFLALSKVVRPGYWFTESQIAKIFGVSERESALLSALSKRLGISIVLRSRASEAIKFLEEGVAVMKPYWIKTKNVNFMDTQYLGYKAGEVGKVVIRKPLSLATVEENMLANGLRRDSLEWNQVLKRRKTRIKEYDGEYKQMQKWAKQGKVDGKWPWQENGVDPLVQADETSSYRFRLNTENGAVVPEIFIKGEGWKFITGDIDLIAITKADGSALSDAEHVGILKQLVTVLGSQHPESATWIRDGLFWFKQKADYLLNDGECCLAQYGPDGRVRAVQFNQKLSDPESWTKLAYRIIWNGGYQAGPGQIR